jgi:hypothetical protein
MVADTDAGSIVQELQEHNSGVASLAVSAGGSRRVSGDDNGTARVCDDASGVEVGEPLQGQRVRCFWWLAARTGRVLRRVRMRAQCGSET